VIKNKSFTHKVYVF